MFKYALNHGTSVQEEEDIQWSLGGVRVSPPADTDFAGLGPTASERSQAGWTGGMILRWLV